MIRRTVICAIIAVVMIASQPILAAIPQHNHEAQTALTMEQLHSKILPMSLKTLEAISQATQSGDKQTAIKELAHLQQILLQIQSVIAKEVGPAFANTKCPIMGSPINPDKVPANLVREYKGQKIGFCCAGCPAQWDKLSDAQKQAKLAKVKAPAADKLAH